MRLRYLSLHSYPPLNDLSVCFASDAPWAALAQDAPSPCAIHFVVGLNGSGKSHLLRALASIFVALSDGRLPGFSFSLIYELGTGASARTILFDNSDPDGEPGVWQANGSVFAKDMEATEFKLAIKSIRQGSALKFIARIAPGDYPQTITDVLPKVLAYTSGSWDTWNDIWAIPADTSDQSARFPDDEDFPYELERPIGWTDRDEEAWAEEEGKTHHGVPLAQTLQDIGDLPHRPILLNGSRPDAALLAVALNGLLTERRTGLPLNALAHLFAKAGWQRLVTIRLHVDLNRVLLAPRALQYKLHDALLVASEVISQPDPTDKIRVLHFDVDAPFPGDLNCHDPRLHSPCPQDEALTMLLGEDNQSAFSRFTELSRWLSVGLVDHIDFSIRRNLKPQDPDDGDSGVMSYAALSDGEQMVLRRWALFHLLQGQQDALMLLDEPETHFNDAWKREIVSIIESAMGQDASSVLIASHSAIVLSDVFDEEIIHIKKTDNGRSSAHRVASRTFGTDPSALMMNLFQTDDSIGMRAQRRIEEFVEHLRNKTLFSKQDISDLESVIARMGTGFYKSELQALLRHHKASQDQRVLNETIMNVDDVHLKAALLMVLAGHSGNDDMTDA